MKLRTTAGLMCLLLIVLLRAAAAQPPAADRPLFPPDVADKVKASLDVEYAKAGEISLRLDVLEPRAASDEPRPALVFIHGGGWMGGDKRHGVRLLAPFVASGEYVGFTVGYRLSGVAKWPAQIHDCKAAIRWIRAHAGRYGVDPDRIGVWGISAGGHLVSLLGTSGGVAGLEGPHGLADVSSRVTCVVNFCGPSDFLAFEKRDPTESRPGRAVYGLFGGPPSELPEAAREASPVTYVSADDPPFLIVHGTNDATVPFDQAERLYRGLKEAGADATLVRIEGGGHGIGGPEVQQRVQAFLARHLLGKDVEVSTEPIETR